MIQVIAGKKGSGKTKRLIDVTNEALKVENGVVAFIDDDKRYMYDLRHEVRFIDASEYSVLKGCTAETFYGFISGMLSINYDLTLVCVDAFLKLVTKNSLDEMKDFFEKMEAISTKSNCKFVFSVSEDIEKLPDFVKQYIC